MWAESLVSLVPAGQIPCQGREGAAGTVGRGVVSQRSGARGLLSPTSSGSGGAGLLQLWDCHGEEFGCLRAEQWNLADSQSVSLEVWSSAHWCAEGPAAAAFALQGNVLKALLLLDELHTEAI